MYRSDDDSDLTGLQALRRLQEQYSVDYLGHLLRDLPEDTEDVMLLAHTFLYVILMETQDPTAWLAHLHTLLLLMFARGLDVGRRKAVLEDKRWVVREE